MIYRIYGKHFNTAYICDELARLVPERNRRRTKPVPALPRVARDSVPERKQNGTRSRERDKGIRLERDTDTEADANASTSAGAIVEPSLPNAVVDTQPPSPAELTTNPQPSLFHEPIPKGRLAHVDQRSPAVRNRHAIIDAIGERVRLRLSGITITDWKKQQYQAAKALVDAGKTADEVVAFWDDEFERTGTAVVWLRELQRRIVNASARDDEPEPEYVNRDEWTPDGAR